MTNKHKTVASAATNCTILYYFRCGNKNFGHRCTKEFEWT
eukprot:UN15015